MCSRASAVAARLSPGCPSGVGATLRRGRNRRKLHVAVNIGILDSMSRKIDTSMPGAADHGLPPRNAGLAPGVVDRLGIAAPARFARRDADRHGAPFGLGGRRRAAWRGGGVCRRVTALAITAVLLSALQGCDRLAVREEGIDGNELELAATAVPRGGQAMPATGAITSASGCRLDYRIHRATTPASDAVVILGHGFLRSKEHMDGLATALAEAGVTAVSLDYCDSRLWDGQHVRNGRDMVALAGIFDTRHVIYGGFSAGALAALVAGQQDPNALGVIALDPVDDRGLGVRIAERLDRPLIGIVGEPSACNANGNGLAIIAAGRHSRLAQVRGARHCDFESPPDGMCELVCGQSPEADHARRQIIEMAVSAAVSLLGPGDGATVRPAHVVWPAGGRAL
jgi:hypothetical protein